MSSDNHHHIVPYRTYFIVLVVLLALTFASIGITSIELRGFTVAAALLFAVVKTYLVLIYFMHLKYDKPYIGIMVGFVFLLFLVVIVITFLDYFYRA
jgi:cytochrome c oxidase subunit IV